MYKRPDSRWVHDRDRDRDRKAEPRSIETVRRLRELPLPRRYDERHYPPDYARDRRGRR